MEKFTPIEIKWICGLLERTSSELFTQAKEAEKTSDLVPQMMRLKAEQYAGLSFKFRNALKKKSKRLEIKY